MTANTTKPLDQSSAWPGGPKLCGVCGAPMIHRFRATATAWWVWSCPECGYWISTNPDGEVPGDREPKI